MEDIRNENEVMFEEQATGISTEGVTEDYSYEGESNGESGSGLLGKGLLLIGGVIAGVAIDKIGNKLIPAVKDFAEDQKEKREEKKALKAEKKAKKKSKNEPEVTEETEE